MKMKNDMLSEFDALRIAITQALMTTRDFLQNEQYSDALQTMGLIARNTEEMYVAFADVLKRETR